MHRSKTETFDKLVHSLVLLDSEDIGLLIANETLWLKQPVKLMNNFCSDLFIIILSLDKSLHFDLSLALLYKADIAYCICLEGKIAIMEKTKQLLI